MTTNHQSAEPSRNSVREGVSLEPFHGEFSPGICFASGHCICPNNHSSTPTPVGAFAEVWIMIPDGERRLYVDPPEAGDYSETYHDFDRTVGATITWDLVTEDRVELYFEGEDGTTVSLHVELGVTTEYCLLNVRKTLISQPIIRTSIGQTISNLSFSQLIETNGMNIAGRTEIHEPYRVEPDYLRAITSASATLNHENLGGLAPPDRPIAFGDHRVPNKAFMTFGDLYLRPPKE